MGDYGLDFSCLIGEVIAEITGAVDDEEMIIKCQSGRIFKLFHVQDCCESVLISDICGDLSDLIGEKVLTAEESTNSADIISGSCTWTFYRVGTVSGQVTIRWYGESNGYYSESVRFEEVKS